VEPSGVLLQDEEPKARLRASAPGSSESRSANVIGAGSVPSGSLQWHFVSFFVVLILYQVQHIWNIWILPPVHSNSTILLSILTHWFRFKLWSSHIWALAPKNFVGLALFMVSSGSGWALWGRLWQPARLRHFAEPELLPKTCPIFILDKSIQNHRLSHADPIRRINFFI